MKTKNELRSMMREKKRSIGKATLKLMSKEVCEAVLANEQYERAGIVMAYAALWDEVDVQMLIDDALGRGKRVILPTVRGEDIVPVELSKNTQWKVGDFGIMEPLAERYDGDIDLVIVPGVAFDNAGNRLGRGRGFYDRFLCKCASAYLMGVCFDFQVVAEVPTDDFDFKMCEIITCKY